MNEETLKSFIAYCAKHIKGDEKGEAQIFLDHFFTAFGYADGLKGAGAECEFRIKDEKKRSTSFADLVWKPRVLIEMKKRDEDLSLHYQQALEYWFKLVPNRPQFVILCNFDEFWIYDFNLKISEPVDIIAIGELASRSEAFSFLLPKPKPPVFNKDREDVTELAAKQVSHAFLSMADGQNKRVSREDALHYCLQCVVAMFAEDVNLLPEKIFTRIIEELEREGGTGFDKVPLSYDLIGGLFQAMNTQGIKPGGKYRGVDYFNGGLFEKILPIELTKKEIEYFESASNQTWRKVNPAIFGSLFEGLMLDKERHKLGAHYTHEKDIMKIVDPVIVRPWRRKIEDADTLDELIELIEQLRNFKVLDPACGSGNFLFVAYREMKNLEKQLLARIRALRVRSKEDSKRYVKFMTSSTGKYVSTKQFYGIDIKPDAVELAKVTLMIAKELWYLQGTHDKNFDREDALPLDNLDENIICTDSLFTEWPEVDAIIGNPPYQSKNKMQQEFGAEYVNKLHSAFPEVPGRADFCVYWFYKAHKRLKEDGYAGLVGTNTIRQNYSREGSLDYIVNNGGTIIEAVSTEPWIGDAVVYVSIVAWKKGEEKGIKNLYYGDEKRNIELHKQETINSSLSLSIDVVSAFVLECNKVPKKCFQGQTHGNEGFLISVKEAEMLLKENKKNAEVLHPFLIGDELVGSFQSQPKRFVIDFSKMDMIKASSYKEPFKILQEKVLPEIEEKAELERTGKIKANGRDAWLKMWWKMWRRREDMLDAIADLKRYISISRVSKRPIFEFIDSQINPNDALMVFAFEDDYSYGIIQSDFHWKWFLEKCSTLKGDARYTTDSVWNTFPWPQTPNQKQIEKVAVASKALRDARNKAMQEHHYSLRDLYRILEQPGKNPIKDLHAALDKAVMEAYSFDETKDILTQLLQLNKHVHEKETRNEKVTPPGLPEWVKNKEKFVSGDCVKWEG